MTELLKQAQEIVQRLMYEWQYSKISDFDPDDFIFKALVKVQREERERLFRIYENTPQAFAGIVRGWRKMQEPEEK